MRQLTLLLACVLGLMFSGVEALAQDGTTLTWDFDAPLDRVKTFTQTISIDGQTVTGMPTCLASSAASTTCSLPIGALAAGQHTLSIDAALNGSSAKTIFTGLDVAVALPNAKSARVSIVVTIPLSGSTPTTPGGMGSGVKAAPFVDPEGHKWALVGTDVQCEGERVGGPVSQVVLASGRIYAFGAPDWFLASGCAKPQWSNVGPQTPRD